MRLCLASLPHSPASGKWLDPGEERSKDQTFLGSEVPPSHCQLGLQPSFLWLLQLWMRISNSVPLEGHCGYRVSTGAGPLREVSRPVPPWLMPCFPVPQASWRSGRCVSASWPSGRCTPASTWP